jgi:hypothetical protein
MTPGTIPSLKQGTGLLMSTWSQDFPASQVEKNIVKLLQIPTGFTQGWFGDDQNALRFTAFRQ